MSLVHVTFNIKRPQSINSREYSIIFLKQLLTEIIISALPERTPLHCLTDVDPDTHNAYIKILEVKQHLFKKKEL